MHLQKRNYLIVFLVLSTNSLLMSEPPLETHGLDRVGGVKAARKLADETKAENLKKSKEALEGYLVNFSFSKDALTELEAELRKSGYERFEEIALVLQKFEDSLFSERKEKKGEREEFNAKMWDYFDWVNVNEKKPNLPLRYAAQLSKVKSLSDEQVQKGLESLLSESSKDKFKAEKIPLFRLVSRERSLRALGEEGRRAVEAIFTAKTKEAKAKASAMLLKTMLTSGTRFKISEITNETLGVFKEEEKKRLSNQLRLSDLENKLAFGGDATEDDPNEVEERRRKLLGLVYGSEASPESIRELAKKSNVSEGELLETLADLANRFYHLPLKDATQVARMSDEELRRVATAETPKSEIRDQITPPVLKPYLDKVLNPLKERAQLEVKYREGRKAKADTETVAAQTPVNQAGFTLPVSPPKPVQQENPYLLGQRETRKTITDKEGNKYELFKSVNKSGTHTFLYKLDGEKSYTDVFNGNRFKEKNLSLVTDDGKVIPLNEKQSEIGNLVFGTDLDTAYRWTRTAGMTPAFTKGKQQRREFTDGRTYEVVQTVKTSDGRDIVYYGTPQNAEQSGYVVYPDGRIFQYWSPSGHSVARKIR